MISVCADRVIFGTALFNPLDIVTYICISIFLLSAIKESKILKLLQVLLILLVAFVILFQGNYYLSLALITNAFFITYVYGAYNKYTKIKISLSIIIVYAIFVGYSSHISSGLISMINWLVFIVVHVLSIWIVFSTTIDKAKHYDNSKEMQLSIKLNEAHEELIKLRSQVDNMQSRLVSAAEYGLELIEIVKEFKNGK